MDLTTATFLAAASAARGGDSPDWTAVLGVFFAAVAAAAALVALVFAWQTVKGGEKTAIQLDTIATRLEGTVEALERGRREDWLMRQLDRYERLLVGVHQIMLASATTRDYLEQVALIRQAQATMRGALVGIPGANGSAGSPLVETWTLSRNRVGPATTGGRSVAVVNGGNAGSAETEIDAAVRVVLEELEVLMTSDATDQLPPLRDEATAIVTPAGPQGGG